MANSNHPLPNNYWVRHFLICNALAKAVCLNRGWQIENFAKTILQEREGVYANEQMNCYFWSADQVLSDIRGNDSAVLFDALEHDHDIYIQAIAALSTKQIQGMYQDYCEGKIKI